MKALILAAGYATRLYPLTKDYPKPLLRVGKHPLIEHIIAQVDAVKEIEEIVVVTNHKFISIFRDWAAGVRSRAKLTVLDDLTQSEGDRLGAVGDIAFAIDNEGIRDDLLVVGGDNLFDASLKDFIDFSKRAHPSPVIGVYDFKDISRASTYGVVEIDSKQKVTHFQEKPQAPRSSLVAMCLYYFPREKLPLVQEYLRGRTEKHDATGFYIDWLSKKEDVYAWKFEGRWYDIGDLDFYNKAKEQFS
ncbi:MAG TPA: nucleotidyltransferase family protein [Patescibacteria group bacterium]|nr:nucleotidyltransferase family protein [Patescibacteria group bacterium]